MQIYFGKSGKNRRNVFKRIRACDFYSAASVTRFCQKIGVKGFPEFKMQFVRELRTGGMEDVSAVTMSERENVVTMVRKAEKIQRQAVKETNKELSYTQLVRIGKLIADASCVDFYVYDMNIYLAKYGCALFFHAGKLSSVHSEINIQGLHAAMPADGHVAIIISHTGKNEQLAEIEKMLHRGGTENYRNLRKQERRGRSICNRVFIRGRF